MRDTFVFSTEEILGDTYFGSDAYFGASTFFGGTDAPYQFEIRPSIQKCQSFRLEINDLNPDGIDGPGMRLSTISLEVGVKKGMFRVGSTRRVGPS